MSKTKTTKNAKGATAPQAPAEEQTPLKDLLPWEKDGKESIPVAPSKKLTEQERIGKNIANVMREKEITVLDLAKRLETTTEFVEEVIAGKRSMSFETEERFATALGVEYERVYHNPELDVPHKKWDEENTESGSWCGLDLSRLQLAADKVRFEKLAKSFEAENKSLKAENEFLRKQVKILAQGMNVISDHVELCRTGLMTNKEREELKKLRGQNS